MSDKAAAPAAGQCSYPDCHNNVTTTGRFCTAHRPMLEIPRGRLAGAGIDQVVGQAFGLPAPPTVAEATAIVDAVAEAFGVRR